MEFTVQIEVVAGKPVTDEMLSALAAIGGAASGTPGGNRIGTTLTVEGADVAHAANEAIKRVLKIVGGHAVDVRAATCEEFDRAEEEAREREKLAGTSELATQLGISKQRVAVLSRRADFPAPVARLASGPVWRERDLVTFGKGWRRAPGRPKVGEYLAAHTIKAVKGILIGADDPPMRLVSTSGKALLPKVPARVKGKAQRAQPQARYKRYAGN